MNKLIIVITIFFSLLSCNPIVPKPEKLIDDDVMIDIFYDLALLDAIKNQGTMTEVSKVNPNQFILKKYNVDSLQFAQNNRYYASNVSKYKRMYNKVNDKLTAKSLELDQQILKNNEKQSEPLNGNQETGQIK